MQNGYEMLYTKSRRGGQGGLLPLGRLPAGATLSASSAPFGQDVIRPEPGDGQPDKRCERD